MNIITFGHREGDYNMTPSTYKPCAFCLQSGWNSGRASSLLPGFRCGDVSSPSAEVARSVMSVACTSVPVERSITYSGLTLGEVLGMK
jgi:hypothetical protein